MFEIEAIQRDRISAIRVLLPLYLLIASIATLRAGDDVFPPREVLGKWVGSAHIVVDWTRQQDLAVSVTIHDDCSVTGTVGDATLIDGKFKTNRGAIGKALNLGDDYIITGQLQGAIIASEGVRRESVFIPFNIGAGQLAGGVATSGSMFGGKESMVLTAQHLVLRHPPDAVQALANEPATNVDINTKVASIEIGKASARDVIKVFGKPESYVWAEQSFDESNLPDRYIMVYPAGPNVVIVKNVVDEVRFEQGSQDFAFEGRLRIGSSLEDALAVVGAPEFTVDGKLNRFEDKTLYKNIDGSRGIDYYQRSDKGVRIFFSNDRITAIYLTAKSIPSPKAQADPPAR